MENGKIKFRRTFAFGSLWSALFSRKFYEKVFLVLVLLLVGYVLKIWRTSSREFRMFPWVNRWFSLFYEPESDDIWSLLLKIYNYFWNFISKFSAVWRTLVETPSPIPSISHCCIAGPHFINAALIEFRHRYISVVQDNRVFCTLLHAWNSSTL